MWRLLIQMTAGVLGFWISSRFVNGVSVNGLFFLIPKEIGEIKIIMETLVFSGCFWGFLNFFVKPVIKLISLPIRILTLNFFSLIIAIGLVWITDLISPELSINGLKPLFITTIILWLSAKILEWWLPRKK